MTAAPDLDPLLSSQDWPSLAARLTHYAFLRLGRTSWHTAEDLAQQAIVQLLDPAYATWDRERHPDLFFFLGHLVNGLVANLHRKSRRTKHLPLREDLLDASDDDPSAPRPPADTLPSAELLTAPELAAAAEEHRKGAALAALRDRLAGDALALGVVDQIQSDVGGPAAQARALGVDVRDVYTAKRRIMHHARALARDLETENQA